MTNIVQQTPSNTKKHQCSTNENDLVTIFKSKCQIDDPTAALPSVIK